MASLSAEQREALRTSTLPACGPFLEDIQHLKRIVANREHSPSEIRHLSAILRRFLVERLLPILGAARVGKIKIGEPDNKPIYKWPESAKFALFLSGGVASHGLMYRAAFVRLEKVPFISPPGFDPDRVVEVPADNFLDQRIVCLRGQWVNRREVIKYVANVASGVHAGEEETEADKLIGKVRQCAALVVGDKQVELAFNIDAVAGAPRPFTYDPALIDPILFEILAAARFVVLSKDVLALEAAIAAELGQPAPP